MIYVKVNNDGVATHIIDDETGNTVDLTGLSSNERAYCLIVAGHDPKTYDGRWGPDCLIGQVGRLTLNREDREPTYIGLAYLSRNVRGSMDQDDYPDELERLLGRIYHLSAEKPYNLDGQAALDMAREELGVDLDNLPKEMENFPAPGSDGT